MKVLVTGATGFIGYSWVKKLVAGGHEIVILTRNPDSARARFAGVQNTGAQSLHFYGWDALQEPPPDASLQGVEGIVHLAGEPIGAARWTVEQKKKIRQSRVLGTRHLVRGLTEAGARPRVLISSSAIGFYGDRGDEKLNESSSAGHGFLSEVCRDWEREVLDAGKIEGLRIVRIRTGMVLGREGGALPKLLPIFRWGAGGPIGSGSQWMSWIHLEDLVSMMEWICFKNQEITGVVNGVAPAPVTNFEFSKELGLALNRPSWLAVPTIAARFAMGEMSDLVLQSQRVLPRVAQENGFVFQYPELKAALKNLLA